MNTQLFYHVAGYIIQDWAWFGLMRQNQSDQWKASIPNKMNPRYFSLAATALKLQQKPMFLHISARVWGHR